MCLQTSTGGMNQQMRAKRAACALFYTSSLAKDEDQAEHSRNN